MATEIDIDGIYESVFALYGVEFDYEVALQVKKMEYVFLKQQPLNQDFISYIECLTEAHNQMLFYIQDPKNRYSVMETNPINSKDLMHGVPSLFQEILNEITQHVEMLKQTEAMPFTLSVIEDLKVEDEESSRSGLCSDPEDQSGQ